MWTGGSNLSIYIWYRGPYFVPNTHRHYRRKSVTSKCECALCVAIFSEEGGWNGRNKQTEKAQEHFSPACQVSQGLIFLCLVIWTTCP